MKPEWRRFAPIGLYIAIAAALAALVLYFVQREFNLWIQIALGLSILGLAIFVFLDPDRIRKALTGRQARYGSNALILTLAFVGILVVINYLVLQNSKRWDLTEDQTFTLAPETIETLASLPEDVTAQAFFSPQVNAAQAQGLLDQYKFHSDGAFDYTFIDPIANPVVAEAAGIARDGSVVLVMGAEQEIVTNVSEQELTGGLVRLISSEERVIYFLTGHGEYSLEGAEDQSYSQIIRILESKNYIVKSLNLLSTNTIPVDATVIVIAGPQKPVSPGEVEMIAEFIEAGGGLVVMQEPVILTDFGDTQDPMAEYLASSWGIFLGLDFVIDQSSSQPSFAIGSEWGAHPTVEMLRGFVSVMPTARSVSIQQGPEGVSQVTLVSTGASAWAETDMEALAMENAQVEPNPEVDFLGPVPLVAAGENFNTESRIVVYGDADFPTNGFFSAYANADLFINTVDWSAGQEELINLTPKETTSRTVVPPQSYAMNLILLLTVFVLPGLALFGSVMVVVQKRRRG